MAKILGIISWVLLTLMGVLLLLGALASAQLAFSKGDDQFGTVTLADLTGGDQSLANLIHARRVTAAAFTAAYSVLLLSVVLFPYRRGEVWSWWAILIATLVGSLLIILRVPLLDVQLGASVGYFQLGVVIVALLLGAGRLRRAS